MDVLSRPLCEIFEGAEGMGLPNPELEKAAHKCYDFQVRATTPRGVGWRGAAELRGRALLHIMGRSLSGGRPRTPVPRTRLGPATPAHLPTGSRPFLPPHPLSVYHFLN